MVFGRRDFRRWRSTGYASRRTYHNEGLARAPAPAGIPGELHPAREQNAGPGSVFIETRFKDADGSASV